MPRTPRARLVSRLLIAGAVLLLAFVGLALASVPAMVGAADDAAHARLEFRRAERHLALGRREEAGAALERAGGAAARAARTTRGRAPSLLSHVPLAGRTIVAVRDLAEAAAQAARAGRGAVQIDPTRIWRAGAVDVAALPALRDAMASTSTELASAAGRARRTPAWPLPGTVGRARAALVEQLTDAARGATAAERLLQVLPAVVGGDAPRRYFLAVQNPAELRGTGGFWGNFGVLEVTAGRIRLTVLDRPENDLRPSAPADLGPEDYRRRYARFAAPVDFRQVNMSPDLPTVARILEANLPGTPVGAVDGVVVIDPLGLSDLMRLTGPVRVPGWPGEITSSNVVKVTIHDAYGRFPDNRSRQSFLGEVAATVVATLETTDTTGKDAALARLGNAVAQRRLQFHFRNADEQRALVAAGSDGSLGPPETIGLVSQNAAANKMDIWLKRRLDVRVRLRRDGSASVDATVALSNTGPSSGEPAYVIGPNVDGLGPGDNRQFVSLYVPRSSRVVSFDSGDGIRGEVENEGGLVVVSRFVDIRPGETKTLHWRLDVPRAWDRRTGELSLVLRRQPSLWADATSIEIRSPSGWGWRAAPQAMLRGDRAVWRDDLTTDVRLRFDLGASFIRRLVGAA